MPVVLLLLFLVLPLVELYVIIQVGGLLGVLPTIGLLLLASIVGAWLVRREGAKAWAAFRRAMDEGRVPARETADGALVILGGALLLTPGFVTDVIGLCCVAPPTRAMVRGALTAIVTARFAPLRMYEAGRTGYRRAERVRRYAARRAERKAEGRRPANVPPPPANVPPPPSLPPE